jgi:hypothetical protein
MALGTPVAGAAAYSASAGTSVAPAYPAGILATDAVLLFVGQKPSTANGGTVTTPTGWTLREELLAAGGYGTTLGADTGNTNLRVYSWDSPVAGQTGTRSVTLAGNGVSWAFMVRVPTGGGALSYGSADGQRTTTPTSPMAIALTNGATATNFQAGDKALWAMCIPTDVTTPSQFSAQSITATGATFATATELNEPDSATGNDIGGYSAYAHVNSGSSTTAPTVTATLTGTLTNVRGPVVLVRIREAAPPAITGDMDATETGNDTFAATGDVLVEGSLAATETGADTFAATGTVTDPGITGSMAATETGADTFAATGDVIVKGSLAATETGQDTFAATGDVIVKGALSATETGSDAFSATGDVIVEGMLSASETGADTFAATGTVGSSAIVGTMAATETGADTFTASGAVIVAGSFAASETGNDVFAATGTVGGAAVTGIMAATEYADIFGGYVFPAYVDDGYAESGITGTVTGTGNVGGGPGNAQKGKRKGWANERRQFELSQQVQEAKQTLAKSEVKAARRLAAKLEDYTLEIVDFKKLQYEFAKLEAQYNNSEQMAADMREAAQAVKQFLQDEQDAIDLLILSEDFDARCVISSITRTW